MVLEAFVLGTSGSLPLPYRALSSVLLHREGEEILFDCGEGMQLSLRIMNIRWKALRVICISHSHADHVTGLPGLLMLSSQVEREKELVIVCPKSVKDYIEATRRYLGIYINYNIEYRILEDIERDGVVYVSDNADYYITAFPGKHKRAVWGFSLIEEKRPGKFYSERAIKHGVPRGPQWAMLQQGKTVVLEDGSVVEPSFVMGNKRSGRKVSYVTDTRPTDRIIQAVSDSDVFFCEGMFKQEHIDAAKEKLHMTGCEAAHLCTQAGNIGKAGLIHFSPRYLKDDILAIEREAKKIFPDIFCCRDRMYMNIPYKE